jgi:peptidoglycan/LPS O-acetylase OafA/YrhL
MQLLLSLLALTLAEIFVMSTFPKLGGPLSGALTYLPMFMIAALMAAYFNAAQNLIRDVERLGPIAVAALWIAVLALYISDWLPLHAASLSPAIPTLGATGLVALFAFSTSGSRFESQSTVSWLGARSFSLYLVHGPIVVALAYALAGRGWLPWAVLLTAAPLSLLVTDVFYRLIERPSHKFARSLGSMVRKPIATDMAGLESLG